MKIMVGHETLGEAKFNRKNFGECQRFAQADLPECHFQRGRALSMEGNFVSHQETRMMLIFTFINKNILNFININYYQ
jgi:hypothetical protein